MSALAAVARELEATRAATGATREPRAMSLRRQGIDYEGLPPALSAAAIEPGDGAYAEKRASAMRAGSPGLILPVRTAGEVRDALAFARRQSVALPIRSGGHDLSGRSTNDGGIVIDLPPMNAIEMLDPATRRVRIEQGRSSRRSPRSSRPTAGRRAPATTAASAWEAWRAAGASAGWCASTA